MKAFDMHCDTLLGGNRNHLDLVNDQMHISLDKLGAFEHYVQCFAIFIPDQFRGQDLCMETGNCQIKARKAHSQNRCHIPENTDK